MNGPPRIAVAWLLAVDWQEWKRLDPHGLQASYKDWLKDAQAGLKQLERAGMAYVRVEIDVKQAVALAREMGFGKIDGRARGAIATALAARQQNQ